jgi:hypothetical protein
MRDVNVDWLYGQVSAEDDLEDLALAARRQQILSMPICHMVECYRLYECGCVGLSCSLRM